MPLHENSLLASVGFPYDEVEDEEPLRGANDHFPETLEFARRLVSYIRSHDRARLTVDCLYLALGDAEVEAETMSTVGAKHGITKAAVSKRVKKIRADLHLPPTSNNKSSYASHKYSRTNRSPLNLDIHAAIKHAGVAPRRS